MKGRKIKTRLDISYEQICQPKLKGNRYHRRIIYVHGRVRQFAVGQKVLVDNISTKFTDVRWLPGIVLEKSGAAMYRVLVDNWRVGKKHSDQIVAQCSPTAFKVQDDVESFTDNKNMRKSCFF